ncbi:MULTISPECIES: bifunctional isocitrate dehydrogenase kinase/phosphatase [Rhodopseudomonas]|uniref:Isocitrate dehydrogenase n=1 Tax=Rhodopseudomonas palustris TaxID=1076 RepID=A0A0D7EKW6_RHOPL|nr:MULTISPECIES: bifunctional isocitrate dehydrogenase kinase/phosphatase [Rhodopseudomonas]KIZ41266.1 isocitrate dehydrogenase [Rhodopseudomonas palustris]MDF3810603.1 bifunctional isocitrate dehydrogenase kinase/phosphatase [Rhodopseudomonas sp. BAL398]WOK16505.1 bifunctional isocitrate dehydrogenase kinase/phosphatase [Rhodopseudomonas sp. BAL398]
MISPDRQNPNQAIGTRQLSGALKIAEPDFELLDELFRASELEQQAPLLARVVLEAFTSYYAVSRRIPQLVKAAFEARDWPATVQLSRDRLTLYTACLDQLTPLLHAGLPESANDERLWALAEAELLAAIATRYEADFVFAFWQSLRRMLLRNEWRPISYEAGITAKPRGTARAVIKTFPARIPIEPGVIHDILEMAGFTVPGRDTPWRDLDGDAARVANAIAAALEPLGPRDGEAARIEMANSGFFRNREACLVGRIVLRSSGDRPLRSIPLMLALRHDHDGLSVDAVLCESDELQYAFSPTLANFHVTNPHYHELALLLSELMPKRPLGLHYSTIGFHHLGKVAVMTEILSHHRRSKEKFDTAPGLRGTVAIAFTMPGSGYVLKIIRDHPTDDYKWDRFEGPDSVLRKYHLVHEMDRAGAMLDNIIYTNVKLERAMFAPDLLDELLEAGIGNVSLDRSALVFRQLIVQMKLVPLPLFLAKASPAEARTAVINLGHCIRNNAAANIFNRDLDSSNYGVSRTLKVYLFDYHAVEPLTDVTVHNTAGCAEGEPGLPHWQFEQGAVFAPDDMEAGLRIDDFTLRRVFRDAHADLLRADYWEAMQRALRAGEVPEVMSYPAARRLPR